MNRSWASLVRFLAIPNTFAQPPKAIKALGSTSMDTSVGTRALGPRLDLDGPKPKHQRPVPVRRDLRTSIPCSSVEFWV